MAELAQKLEGYDVVVVNSAWWDLKPWGEKNFDFCGRNWTADCESRRGRSRASRSPRVDTGIAGCSRDYERRDEGV